jgi:hypothetical protein
MVMVVLMVVMMMMMIILINIVTIFNVLFLLLSWFYFWSLKPMATTASTLGKIWVMGVSENN